MYKISLLTSVVTLAFQLSLLNSQEDLTSVSSTTITCNPLQTNNTWITDRDGSTCNQDINLQSVVVAWNTTYRFSWMRLTVNDTAYLGNFNVSFRASGNTEIDCSNQKIYVRDSKTLDISCQMTVDVMKVIIGGQSVNSLCSLNISGACEPGWFGSSCQFQCHCTSGCTTTTPECPSNFRCEKEWFGSACQYKDIANLASTTINCIPDPVCTWLTDRNDETCYTGTNLQSVVITLNTTYPYTWLRLAVNNNASFNSLQVSFKTDTSADMACTNQLNTTIDARRMDIRCDTMFDVKQVIIKGQGLKSLCSVYINGGRNVALKQAAVQSSIYTKEGVSLAQASNAIDGDTHNSLKNQSCSHTNGYDDDTSPNWNVTFSKLQVVNRIVLYNRNDCCQIRLVNFTLQTLDAHGKIVYDYTEPNNAPQVIYTVTVKNEARNIPVSKINIRATSLLTICEMEAFGDCSPGSWGLDCVPCDGKCNTCHPETGACLVCNSYNYPPSCNQTCLPGTYGINCAQRCSTNWSQSECDTGTGFCKGCPNGYKGHFCDEATTKAQENPLKTTVIGLRIGLGVACAIIIALLIVIFILKRKQPITEMKRDIVNYDTTATGKEYTRQYETIEATVQYQNTAKKYKTNEDGTLKQSKVYEEDKTASNEYESIGLDKIYSVS